ncbi:sensor histidine kinase [Streptacidiphilus griseoplanus]|uniref:sensor histidine kinase n=1 Tax=Peterkaempfera griseoplana TaxID=66896 RepID=UPI0006E28DD6|nr:ATP-binding protein [Peterkaempfera griseoplana]
MLLHRLRVRQKLNALILIPLAAVLALSVPVVTQNVREVQRARHTASLMHSAAQLGGLIEQLQREQLLSVSSVAAPTSAQSPLAAQISSVAATLHEIRSDSDIRPNADLDAALDDVEAIGDLHTKVMQHTLSASAVNDRYNGLVGRLVDSLRLWQPRDGDSHDLNVQSSLDALLRSDVASNSEQAALLASLAGEAESGRSLAAADEQTQIRTIEAERFRRFADPARTRLSRLITTGAVAKRADSLAAEVRNRSADPQLSAGSRAALLEDAANAFLFQDELRLLVQHTMARDAEVEATSAARSSLVGMSVFTAGLLLLVAVVIGLSTTVGRSVSVPLRRLAAAAKSVADATERELTRVADDDLGDDEEPVLLRVESPGRDEIGELADAVNRVQERAYDLLRRQRTSQRNIAAMFAGIGRRTHNMVSRQLAMIDDLERDETDPGLLQSLYELDHLTNRLRRNANNLIVLSGSSEPYGSTEPIAIVHAVRSALAEIEDFQRVRFNTLLDLRVAPDVAPALVSIIAEVLENAVSFSGPDTTVEVTAARVAEGCLITVIDSGVGMSKEQLDEENARLLRRERLDLMPTDVLGLFVVGRLSRQTGIKVTLGAGDDSGTAVWITLPNEYLIRNQAAPQPMPALTSPSVRPALTQHRPAAGAGGGRPSDPGGPGADRATGGQLNRRQAGTHFRHPIEVPVDDAAPYHLDPDAARAMVEHFEQGAESARRDREASGRSGLVGEHSAAPVPAVTARPAPRSTGNPDAAGHGAAAPGPGAADERPDDAFDSYMHQLRRTMAHFEGLTPWSAFDGRPSGARTVPAAAPTTENPALPAGEQGTPAQRLVRRVAGASLPPGFAAATPANGPAPTADPDSARAEIEAFEAGVARALTQDAPPHPHTQERR